jgi:hypothetical protein
MSSWHMGEWRICLEGLRKIAEKLSYNNQCPARDSNRASPEYKSEYLPLEPILRITEKRNINIVQMKLVHCAAREYGLLRLHDTPVTNHEL